METVKKKKILIVDDDDRNLRLLSALCRNLGHDTSQAVNGEEALAAVHDYQPDVVLMDLVMPVMNGFEATAALKTNQATSHIPIIIISALESREERLRGIAQGADDFLTKPVDPEELALRLRNNLRNKEYNDLLENHKEILEEQVAERTRELRSSYIDTINRLVLASEYKDEGTGAHIRKISHYCRELARALGMGEEFSDTIFHASPMHDVGKVAIPDAIILKPGPLTGEEWEIMKSHTSLGASILGGGYSPYLRMAVEIALFHHERWDGSGYPDGLAGEDIPLTARIMNIVDQYDALRSKRPYKPAFDHEKTCRIIIEGDGRTLPGHFDPRVLAAFKRVSDTLAEIYATL